MKSIYHRIFYLLLALCIYLNNRIIILL